MQLLSITQDNIEAYTAFRREIANEEARRYYDRMDLATAILTRGDDLVLQDENGKMLASVMLSRNQNQDGSCYVRISIDGRSKNPNTLASWFRYVLRHETETVVKVDTCFHAYNPPECALPSVEMADMGFAEVPGSYRYERKPGPPQTGEFPYASRAIELGYKAVILDDATIASNPDIFEKLTEIYNHAFSIRGRVAPATPDGVRKSYEADSNTMIIAKLDDEIVASTTLTNLGVSVLGPQISCLRKHWGTGVSDLICRLFTQIVADQWNLPIVAYAEAGNSASWRALERFGLVRNKEYMIWEKLVPAGQSFTL
ncbi:GNAT family N-acetyltransferase [Thalassospira lucentensis]|uniref:GNAT family N-acetyltransferase n=1 Tax=Thalassospira lucentensis TaxID=168935 RepID=UPI003D2E9DD1